MNLQKIKDKLNELRIKRSSLLEISQTTQRSIEEGKTDLRSITEARELIQEAARITEKTAHRQIESVVTTCLQSVFGDEYSFRINFEKKRGRTEAHLKLVKDSEDMDPLSATGGGAVDVLSFALRVTCLILALPRRRRFMVLDEPFKHLSVEYRERVGELLQTLAKDLGIQFLIVTHMPELQIGKVIRL